MSWASLNKSREAFLVLMTNPKLGNVCNVARTKYDKYEFNVFGPNIAL